VILMRVLEGIFRPHRSNVTAFADFDLIGLNADVTARRSHDHCRATNETLDPARPTTVLDPARHLRDSFSDVLNPIVRPCVERQGVRFRDRRFFFDRFGGSFAGRHVLTNERPNSLI
jgi:hypothetical protein